MFHRSLQKGLCPVILGCLRKILIHHEFKFKSKMVIWNSFTDKIIVTSQTWFWAKTTFIQAICHKLEKRRADFFKDYPNAIRFNLIHLWPSILLLSFCCISFMLFNSFKWLLQCFVLLLGHFGCLVKLQSSSSPESAGLWPLLINAQSPLSFSSHYIHWE